MLKLLIATTDLLKSKELINQCIGKISSLQIIGIITDTSEFEDFNSENEFDVLLFHNFPLIIETTKVSYDIISINNFKTPVKFYRNRISLSNTLSFEEMIENLRIFTRKVLTNSVIEKSSQILLDLGFSFKHIGSKYLVDAICYSYVNNFDSSFENLEKDIYPYIAKLNHTHVENIKWSIARSINSMYLNHTTKSIVELEKYFYLEHLQKPTPKLVISMIRNKLLFLETPNYDLLFDSKREMSDF